MQPIRLIAPGTALVACTYGLARYAYGLLLPHMRADLGLTTGSVGLIASSSYAAYLAAIAISACIAARTGPRWLAVLGGLSAAAGMVMIAVSGDAVTLAAGVMVAGTSPGWAYPAMPDAVAWLVSKPAQNRVLSWINSGTSFGVMLAGPVALWAGTRWRAAWLVFAAVALATSFWNARVLPPGTPARAAAGPVPLHWRYLVRADTVPLFLVALLIGSTTSVYLTFAVDLIASAGGQSPAAGKLFWTVVGVAGVAGVQVGDLLGRFGLARVLLGSAALLAAALAGLALAPFSWPVAIASAILFGGGFVAVCGLLSLWSLELFPGRPSAGNGATFFLMSLGQLAGPALAGWIAATWGLEVTFHAAAVLILGVALIRPGRGGAPPGRTRHPA